MAASTSLISYFVPIFAFLLVFLVVYAMLIFVSFILSSFFIIEASLVEFIQFSSSWFAVLVIGLFFLLVILAFLPWKEPLAFLTKGSWFSYVVLAVIIGFFIMTSAHVFNYVVNWDLIQGWLESDWFGMVLLLVIAGIVSWKITGK